MPRKALFVVLWVAAVAAPTAVHAQSAAPVDWSPYVGGPGWDAGPTPLAAGAEAAPHDNAAPGAGDACCPPTCPDECFPPVECCPPAYLWRLSVGAWFLFREDDDNYFFSYDESNEEQQYLNQRDGEFDLLPGFETRLVRFDCCSCTACELVYGQIFVGDQYETVLGSRVPGPLSAILNFDQLNYNGVTADNFTNNAFAHRLRRDLALYNLELNHARVYGGGYGNGVTFSSLAGFRFIKLDEGLQFASDPSDALFTNETDELYYDTDVENNLVGFQFGGYCETVAGARASLYAGAKAGVFGNIAESRSRIGGAAGVATVNNGPFNGVAWDISGSQTGLASVAEFTLGGACRVGRWTLGCDYRLIGLSGVALPAEQIYHDLRGLNDVETLENGSSVLFHGATARLECLF